jgi:hypothetical protein
MREDTNSMKVYTNITFLILFCLIINRHMRVLIIFDKLKKNNFFCLSSNVNFSFLNLEKFLITAIPLHVREMSRGTSIIFT